jgi:hypothetical protein
MFEIRWELVAYLVIKKILWEVKGKGEEREK